MIGQAVSALALGSGHEVIGYTRCTSTRSPLVTRSLVSTSTSPLPETTLDALVHLAGESLFGLWTRSKRERIWKSRVDLTKKIVEQLRSWQPANRPKVLLCASGIGYYGDRGDTLLEENSAPGNGFLAELCQAWEAAAMEAQALGTRVVRLRTGVVLGPNGGAFPLMRRAFACCVGGRFGSGRQWMSWIHEEDQAGLILWALENEGVVGAINLCSPNPVTNDDFTRHLAASLKRPALLHVPAFALRLLMPGMGQEMLLASQRAIPRTAVELGYRFAHPTLEGALTDLVQG